MGMKAGSRWAVRIGVGLLAWVRKNHPSQDVGRLSQLLDLVHHPRIEYLVIAHQGQRPASQNSDISDRVVDGIGGLFQPCQPIAMTPEQRGQARDLPPTLVFPIHAR